MAKATKITSLPFAKTVGTNFANFQSSEPQSACYTPGFTIWYRYTAPSNEVLRAQTVGSNFDTVLDVFSGAPGSFKDVTCDDDIGSDASYPADDNSGVSFHAKAGTTYWFRMGGYSTYSGSLKFNLAKVTPPANDKFANAITITPGYTATVDTSRATHEAGEPETCDYTEGINGETVWYRFHPSSTTQVTFDPGSHFRTEIGVFTGPNLASLVNVTCENGSAGAAAGANALQWTATGGTTYWIQAGGSGGSNGKMTIKFTHP
jgi:hypothetical protein